MGKVFSAVNVIQGFLLRIERDKCRGEPYTEVGERHRDDLERALKSALCWRPRPLLSRVERADLLTPILVRGADGP